MKAQRPAARGRFAGEGLQSLPVKDAGELVQYTDWETRACLQPTKARTTANNEPVTVTATLQPMAISDIRFARDIAACISSASTSSMATTVREIEVRREKLSLEKREPIVVKRSRLQLHPAQY